MAFARLRVVTSLFVGGSLICHCCRASKTHRERERERERERDQRRDLDTVRGRERERERERERKRETERGFRSEARCERFLVLHDSIRSFAAVSLSFLFAPLFLPHIFFALPFSALVQLVECPRTHVCS